MTSEAFAASDWAATSTEVGVDPEIGSPGTLPAPYSDATADELCQEILAFIPNLRAYAHSLMGRSDEADDIVQETIERALTNLHRFKAGTKLQAWLFTILRNNFVTYWRKRRREVQDTDGLAASRLSSVPEQGGHLDLQDLRAALARLPEAQREALLLVGAEGFSYEEVASICNVAIGTVKSRVARARVSLVELLGYGDASEMGPDVQTRAALGEHHF
jgi:RNA polymerase sigma-70 factor (ECF subfamily)